MGNDPLFFNKIAGAILSAGLLAMLTGFASQVLYSPGELATPAYAIAVAEPQATTAKVAAPAGPEPVVALLASASTDAGKKTAKKCTVADFKYSGAMTGMSVNWEFEELNKFLYKPKAYLKGTKMSFAGLKKAKDRAAVIAYLRSLSDSPKPLP